MTRVTPAPADAGAQYCTCTTEVKYASASARAALFHHYTFCSLGMHGWWCMARRLPYHARRNRDHDPSEQPEPEESDERCHGRVVLMQVHLDLDELEFALHEDPDALAQGHREATRDDSNRKCHNELSQGVASVPAAIVMKR
jgi:hypothetical protein